MAPVPDGNSILPLCPLFLYAPSSSMQQAKEKRGEGKSIPLLILNLFLKLSITSSGISCRILWREKNSKSSFSFLWHGVDHGQKNVRSFRVKGAPSAHTHSWLVKKDDYPTAALNSFKNLIDLVFWWRKRKKRWIEKMRVAFLFLVRDQLMCDAQLTDGTTSGGTKFNVSTSASSCSPIFPFWRH